MTRDELAMVCEAMTRLFERAPLDRIEAQAAPSPEFLELWERLEAEGFLALGASEAQGGVGGRWRELAQVARLCGQRAPGLPIVDAMVARALASRAGLALAESRVGLFDPAGSRLRLAYGAYFEAALLCEDGAVALARWPREAAQPLAGAEDGALWVAREALTIERRADAVDFFAGVDGARAQDLAPRALFALMRAAQMAGAMQAALDLSLEHSRTREQFGRPLARFQAIQHHLAIMAGELAASQAALEQACDSLDAAGRLDDRAFDDCAAAKIRVGEASAALAASAHQVHGAIGFTRDYALGRFTRRLWQWQDEFGHASAWARTLGERLCAGEAPALWPHLTA